MKDVDGLMQKIVELEGKVAERDRIINTQGNVIKEMKSIFEEANGTGEITIENMPKLALNNAMIEISGNAFTVTMNFASAFKSGKSVEQLKLINVVTAESKKIKKTS